MNCDRFLGRLPVAMRITIKRINVADIYADASESTNVLEFKELISPMVGFPPEQIRLVCEGRVLENVCQLSQYGVSEQKPVHCLRYVPPPQNQMCVNTPEARAQSGNGADTDAIAEIMNMPMVQRMLSNPDVMRNILRMNPEMNELLDREPEMARLLDDPEILQQSLNAIRNPAMMREMMRQTDRSMSNLETIPGGMDALRRMHTDFADPLFNAMQAPSREGTSNSKPDYEQSTESMTAAPLPNPWAAATSSRSSGNVAGPTAGNPYGTSRPSNPPPAMSPGQIINPFGNMSLPRGAPEGADAFWSMFMPEIPRHDTAVPWFGPPAAGVAPDECRLKVRYGTHTKIVVCKKNVPIAFLKGTVEPLIQVRREHIRLVQAGRVWEDDKRVEFYSPQNDSEVFALKYIPNGESDLGPPSPTVPVQPGYELQFTNQLLVLQDMGFVDRQVCIQTLLSCDGDVNRALDILLFGQERAA